MLEVDACTVVEWLDRLGKVLDAVVVRLRVLVREIALCVRLLLA